MVLALMVPTAMATWPHRAERVESRQLAAVEDVCSAFRPGEVAMMVDSRAANEWPQVLRGQCGVPALSTTSALRRNSDGLFAAVGQVEQAVEARGAQLVAADSDDALRAWASTGSCPSSTGTATGCTRTRGSSSDGHDSLVVLPLQVWLGRTG